MKHKCILFIVSMLLVVGSMNVFAVDERYVYETIWYVTDFDEDYHPKSFDDKVPWTFHRNGEVQAGNLWYGYWRDYFNSHNEIIMTDQTHHDTCIVIFLSDKWFIAIKGGDLYRLGKRAGY
jgi:hypothetical protein